MKYQNDAAFVADLKNQVAELRGRLEQETAPVAVPVTFQNGATDHGTHLYRVGQLVVGVVEITLPTLDHGGWRAFLTIDAPTRDRVDGRTPTKAGEAACDWMIVENMFRAYVDVGNSGHVLNQPVAYVTT